MAEFSIGSGQGITQAIAQNLGLSKDDCKKIKASTWQSVMTLVDQANTQSVQNKSGSIFGGGNNVKSITDKSSWKSNFTVQTGQTMKIDDGIFAKIKQLLSPSATAAPQQTSATPQTTAAQQTAATQQATHVQQTAPAQNVASTQGVTDANGVYQVPGEVFVANTPLEGDVKTGKAAAQALDAMLTSGTGEIPVTSNEWRELAAKPNKTPEEIKKLDAEYATNMKKLGNSMAKYVSETFANGGDIDVEAFKKFQNDGAMALTGLTADEQKSLETSYQTAFNRIDLNKDGKIDSKEMTAYMMSLDFNDKNQMGGVISGEDYIKNAPLLDDPNKNLLDQKLAYSYNKLFGEE